MVFFKIFLNKNMEELSKEGLKLYVVVQVFCESKHNSIVP